VFFLVLPGDCGTDLIQVARCLAGLEHCLDMTGEDLGIFGQNLRGILSFAKLRRNLGQDALQPPINAAFERLGGLIYRYARRQQLSQLRVEVREAPG